jgi:hypothetical protein
VRCSGACAGNVITGVVMQSGIDVEVDGLVALLR